jgi:hypothetical protein
MHHHLVAKSDLIHLSYSFPGMGFGLIDVSASS